MVRAGPLRLEVTVGAHLMTAWPLVLLTRSFSCFHGFGSQHVASSISSSLPTPLHMSATSRQSQPDHWHFDRSCPPRPVKWTAERMSNGVGLSTAFRESSGWWGGRGQA